MVAAAGVDVLVGADVGAVQLRVVAGQAQPDDGAEGAAEQHDFVDAEPGADVLGDLQGVALKALQAHVALPVGSAVSEGLASAAHVPPHDREVPLPGAGARGEDQVGGAGAAVEFQDHRVAAVFAADGHPLVDAADADEPGFLDAVRAGDA
ncbi:hypothetical protein ABGB14_37380 [Nonomuraea sp. B10E15]|uniref:hypothetical protein n=1 Tax=Nonomuraea sp. B10E15 TaxID=3153560 RepID=UPI00325F0022